MVKVAVLAWAGRQRLASSKAREVVKNGLVCRMVALREGEWLVDCILFEFDVMELEKWPVLRY
jgi:hypothetical protein